MSCCESGPRLPNWVEPAAERDLLTKSVWLYLPEPDYDPEGNPPPLHANMSFGAAQALLDDLYRAGFRPPRAHDDADALRAHLADMRAIAFEKLEAASWWAAACMHQTRRRTTDVSEARNGRGRPS